MFSPVSLNGSGLPEKTLCLTFDDGPGETAGEGPGPKTLRLAGYLRQEDITACFFMTGVHLAKFPGVAPQVSAWDHMIGNHSYTHSKPFPELFHDGWDIVSEIEMTDELIRKFNPDNRIYFRAPWGDWSEQVATVLNNKINNGLHHVGPFHWEIGAMDWNFWLRGDSCENCADYYLNEIQTKNRGIVLMHDSTTDLAKARENNLTYETIKILIPKLKSLGYSFVALNEIAF
jgi:peptidoglycan/xylan/chitin deacetylase (PgdA/CDA1 family)